MPFGRTWSVSRRKTESRSSLFAAKRTSSARRNGSRKCSTNVAKGRDWCAFYPPWKPCGSYKPWHDKKTHKTYLKPDDGKCLHYYVYFIDPDLGLCYVRVPTWCPFRSQVYCNGHSYLARQLSQRQIEYRVLDNAFGWIADFEQAQKLADPFSVKMVHRKLDQFADRYCPVVQQFGLSYHWSLDQVEFATDLVFAKQVDLHTRQTDHRPRPEAQTTRHHPHALSTTGWLKVLPSSLRIC